MIMVVSDTSWKWWSYDSLRKWCCCICHFVSFFTRQFINLILAPLSHLGWFLCKNQLNQYKIVILYQPTLVPRRNTCECTRVTTNYSYVPQLIIQTTQTLTLTPIPSNLNLNPNPNPNPTLTLIPIHGELNSTQSHKYLSLQRMDKYLLKTVH